ncbi:mitogen-activated protein kinase kinase kinase 20-like [Impatiens glandulifera]|uniref:mitogen-activated protein kinase kinase kinase 20-like n=1 Tax=Impatiens glandulifera TaxID=253017 RepID=UPI001FB08D92|nr:mitogen-activated protein kinase kinase kinase 20-like [Impatiens glandulifera]XP_047323261.1 mitogen-activated protein kinase kinase kinase 20-like [Impatiens glandulifera]
MVNPIHEWWERGKLLGSGGFGMVSEARPLPGTPLFDHLPQLMAVKSSRNGESLRIEKQMLSKFKGHPNILRYYGTDITNEKTEKGINVPLYNIFLEYASGGCLADEIAKTRGLGLLEEDVKHYLKGILLGLEKIHKSGVIHCDIKPENILIADDRVPKIADFGLAMKGAGVNSKRPGTPEFMAPEIIRHGVYTTAADIWSLGCTVLQMINGRNVWGIPFKSKYISLVGGYNVIPEIPSGLISLDGKDFLNKCFVRDPLRRWTAKSLLNHPFLAQQKENTNFELDRNNPTNDLSSLVRELKF